MPIIEHEHRENCNRHDYTEWLCHVAPDVLWYKIEDWGSYSGQVFGVGEYQGQIIVYKDYYGSCSGCGVWGGFSPDEAGGEPQSQEEVLSNSKLFDDLNEAYDYLKKDDNIYGSLRPDYKGFSVALEEIAKNLKLIE